MSDEKHSLRAQSTAPALCRAGELVDVDVAGQSNLREYLNSEEPPDKFQRLISFAHAEQPNFSPEPSIVVKQEGPECANVSADLHGHVELTLWLEIWSKKPGICERWFLRFGPTFAPCSTREYDSVGALTRPGRNDQKCGEKSKEIMQRHVPAHL